MITVKNIKSEKFVDRMSILKTNLKNSLKKIEPVLIYKDGIKQVCNGELILKTSTPNVNLKEILEPYEFEVTPNEFVENQHLIKFMNASTHELFKLIDKLQANSNIEFVEPNFSRFLKPFTNDPFLSSQWAINNQGYLGGIVGADMNVDSAWNIAAGEDIKVAIIDEGIDLNHPDLVANMLPGFDATGGNSGGAPNNNDAHGTACAGIVAAVANNNIGIAGVAYDSKILPIRIGYSIGNSWNTNNNWIANGINWAVANGADVLSNSWGGGSPSQAVINAINNAVNNGRNGKGSIVIFASGNNNSSVAYPASLENTIAVGASSMCDERKSSSSCDGETWWGSNYGNSIDFVAPGVQIYITDNSGNVGYTFGDYFPSFNGTSAAAPNVAGVAALILSVNPNLTQNEVRKFIEKSADKITGYTYNTVSGRPNGTWNNEVGYGRVNALNAVLKATRIKGVSSMCRGAIESFTVEDLPENAIITWNATYIISGQNTPTVNVGAFTGNNHIDVSVTITYNGETYQETRRIKVKDLSTNQVPTIVSHPNSPANLICCGVQQSFFQAVCSTFCTDSMEWDFDIHYINPLDVFHGSVTTGQITVLKNSLSPIILSTRVRNTSECGEPSPWSQPITRYYGAVQFNRKNSYHSEKNLNKKLPIVEYFVNRENNLYLEFLDLYEWLDLLYAEVNLSEEEANYITNILSNKNNFNQINIKITDFHGKTVFQDNFKADSQIINLSHLNSGVYSIEYSFGEFNLIRKIIE